MRSKKSKAPTLRQKVETYEAFLHKINLFCTTMNHEGIKDLVQNADRWSYAHRMGNGELSDAEQQRAINRAFQRLLDVSTT